MNKVFKVVWSATKHAYVVTSELAKSHQKSATTIVAAVILAASFSGGVANASSPEDWARADLIGSQRWLTPDQNAWGHMQDQHQVDPQQLDQQQQQQQWQQQVPQQQQQQQRRPRPQVPQQQQQQQQWQQQVPQQQQQQQIPKKGGSNGNTVINNYYTVVTTDVENVKKNTHNINVVNKKVDINTTNINTVNN
ncbi:ESPR domain-containing protein, partial [uncultured Veillonella sp.]|uniref:ESPR domain-containing protein n=1 Tax=uncultured Veillonella sp. TaxID=159268 RepID=UPI0028D02B65